MDRETLKVLVKKDLLHQIWLKIDRKVNTSGTKRKKFGEELTGNHSWYSDASNNLEDIRMSSFVRIISLLNKYSHHVDLQSILTKDVMIRAEVLTYLSSNKEEDKYLRNIIKEHMNIFSEIRRSLDILFRQDKLGSSNLNKGYKELKNIMDELECE